MKQRQTDSLLNRIVDACGSILLVATMLYISARLIAAAWVILLIALTIGAGITAAIAVIRNRNSSW